VTTTEKKALKRESIMQASLQLFSLHGFHKTTIPDIAKKLGMSVGNLYNYFSSFSPAGISASLQSAVPATTLR
jgi:AcrR family transcriptional regulator